MALKRGELVFVENAWIRWATHLVEEKERHFPILGLTRQAIKDGITLAVLDQARMHLSRQLGGSQEIKKQAEMIMREFSQTNSDAYKLSTRLHAYSHNTCSPLSQTGFGLAVYRLGSFINHSCRPNCVQVFDAKGRMYVVVSAEQGIKADEELTIPYVGNAYALEIEPRQEALQDVALIDNCACDLCGAGVPTNPSVVQRGEMVGLLSKDDNGRIDAANARKARRGGDTESRIRSLLLLDDLARNSENKSERLVWLLRFYTRSELWTVLPHLLMLGVPGNLSQKYLSQLMRLLQSPPLTDCNSSYEMACSAARFVLEPGTSSFTDMMVCKLRFGLPNDAIATESCINPFFGKVLCSFVPANRS